MTAEFRIDWPDDVPDPNMPADLVAFLAEPEPEHDDAVIPGLLEPGERVLLTAGEGAGKSTLLRQIAVQAASGIHPFTLAEVEPRRVLLVDLENSPRHVRRQLRPLRLAAGPRYQPPRLRINVRPQGLDVLRADDAELLCRQVDLVRPELLIVGPIYKIVGGEAEKEGPARAVTGLLDELRVRHGCAVMLEGHQPWAQNGQRRRPARPYGSSLWSRWPEFGLALGADGSLAPWRGNREQDRGWPAALKRGGPWPWAPDGDRTPAPLPRPSVGRVLGVLAAEFRRDRQATLTVSDIEARVAGDGYGKPLQRRSVQEALATLGEELGDGLARVPLDGRGTLAYRLTRAIES